MIKYYKNVFIKRVIITLYFCCSWIYINRLLSEYYSLYKYLIFYCTIIYRHDLVLIKKYKKNKKNIIIY